jgi:hypothetical protein
MDTESPKSRGREETIIGVVTERPAPGEDFNVETMGSIRLNDIHRSRIVAEVFYNAAVVAGHNPPDKLIFTAGEIFYKDHQVDEVRLTGLKVEELGLKGIISVSPWSTPTPPKFEVSQDDSFVLDPADEERTFIVGRELHPGLSMNWNLEANSDAKTQRVAIVLIPNLEVQHKRKPTAPTKSIKDEHTLNGEQAVEDSSERAEKAVLLEQLESFVHGRPFEHIKHVLALILRPETGEQRDIAIESNFGTLRFSYDVDEMKMMLTLRFLKMVEVTQEDINALTERHAATEERAKIEILFNLQKSVEAYREYASNLFNVQIHDMLQHALNGFLSQIEAQTLRDVNDPALILPDKPNKILRERINATAKHHSKIMDMPGPGRPEKTTKSPEKKRRAKEEFEAKIEEAMLSLIEDNPDFSKTTVARALGCGGSNPKTGTDTSLQAFSQKLKRLGIIYEEILKRAKEGVGK